MTIINLQHLQYRPGGVERPLPVPEQVSLQPLKVQIMRTQRHPHPDGPIPVLGKSPRLVPAALALVSAIMLSACTLIAPVHSYYDREICFTSATPGSFDVWGYNHVPDDSTRNNVIFNREPVSFENGTWIYADTRYWIPQMTYNFYAVAPTATAAELRTSNEEPWHLTISRYDISTLAESGTSADLKLACVSGLIFDPDNQPVGPSSVHFNFNCLLASISITLERKTGSETGAEADAGDLSAMIVGLPRYGTVSSRNYDPTDESTANSCWTLSQETYTETRLTGLPVFPQVLDGSIALNLSGLPTADRDGDRREGATAIIRLSTPTGLWEAVIHYHYTFTVVEDGTLRHGDPETEPLD